MLAAESLALTRTVELGEDDGNTRARARDHEEKEVHHRARNADSGELQIARKAPEDKGVHRIVELLQNIAQRDPDIPSLTVTGTYDEATERTVRALQRQLGIDETGAIGPILWREIVTLGRGY